MKRVLACLSLMATTGTVAFSAPAPPPKHATVKSHAAHPASHAPTRSPAAPADEYFGRLKMSILGIRNTIKDLGLKVEAYPEKANSIWGSADLTEDAIRDWQKKYPHDSWLPGTYYALSHMYTKVANDEGRKRAKRSMQYLVAHFPKTKFAKDGKVELASNLVGAPVVAAADPNAPSAGNGAVAASGTASAGAAPAGGSPAVAPVPAAAAPSPAPTQAPH